LSCLSGRFGFKMKHSALLGYQYNKTQQKILTSTLDVFCYYETEVSELTKAPI
jgi:hypothetical protein